MPTTFVKGDFLNEVPRTGIRAYACPVDTTGQLDVGVSAAVAKRWPALATWWSERCATKAAQLGDGVAWEDGGDVVYLLVMQRRGASAKVSWLERSIQTMLDDAAKRGIERINVPRVWGGQSGLDGQRAKRVVDEVALTAPVALMVYEQFIRKPEGTFADEESSPDSDAPMTELPPTEPMPSTERMADSALPSTKPAKTGAKKKKSKAAAKPAPKKKAAAAKPATKKKAAAKPKAAATKPATKKKAAAKPATKKPATTKKTATKKSAAKKKTRAK